MSDWPRSLFVIGVHQEVCARSITSLYKQHLWLVPAWLTHRHTDSFSAVILLAQPKELQPKIGEKKQTKETERKDMVADFQVPFSRQGIGHRCKCQHSLMPRTVISLDCDHKCWTPLARTLALCQLNETENRINRK